MIEMVPMYGFGSGTTGAALTITAPAGATVAVSKDGKSKTKVADSSGTAVFKGLSSGEWTLSITDGEQTAQKTVTIKADYETAITFFSATIHVTYPAGSTCTSTDGVTTLTAPDTSGTWECVVPNAGTWTIVCDDVTKDIDITNDGQTEDVNMVKYWLFKSGEGAKVDLVGGKDTSSSTNIGTDEIVHTSNCGAGGWASCGTKNTVDLSKYTRLCCEANFKYISGDYSVPTLGVSNDQVIANKQPTFIASTRIGSGTLETFAVDISSLEGNHFIGYWGYLHGSLKNWWME